MRSSTDGTSWDIVTDDGFGSPANVAVASLAGFGSRFSAGTVNQTQGCELWRQVGPIFADDFESGDTSAWSATVP